MISVLIAQQMGIQRSFVFQTLTDTCEIKRLGTPTVDGRGISSPAVRTNVQYNASDTIPCRVEVARAFMNDRDKFQPVVTDNYMLILPFDIDIVETDEVIWLGKTFDIRKLILAGEMDAYVEALMVHTDKNQ